LSVAAQNLIDFWRRFKPTQKHINIHQDDQLVLNVSEKYARLSNETDFEYLNKNGLKFELPPTPILGDLKNAKIVVCMLNPGVNTSDLKAYNDRNLQNRLEKNLCQNFPIGDDSYKFPFLDPELCWTGGFTWWYRKFKPIFDNDMKKQKFVAQNVAAIELFAYPSKSFGTHKLLDTQSTKLAKAWFKEEREKGDKLLIVGRQPKAWGTDPHEVDNEMLAVLSPGESRGGHFANKFKFKIDKILNYKE
jgi:hypothetical protein